MNKKVNFLLISGIVCQNKDSYNKSKKMKINSLGEIKP